MRNIYCNVHNFCLGTSVIMYKNAELRSYQWFSFPDWPGGIYATPTIGRNTRLFEEERPLASMRIAVSLK